MTLITIILFVQLIALALIVFGLGAIGEKLDRIADNAHVTRDGINSIRRRFPELQTVLDRLENHVRHPAGVYGKSPAAIGKTEADELEIVNGP